MGSNSGYTVQAQMRYIMQWFHEWSEMQRQDFLPVLAQKFVPSAYINGLVSGMEGMSGLNNRPPSLFQCRVKLFRDWSDGWGASDKDLLLSQIKAADSAFAAKFEEEVSAEEDAKLSSPESAERLVSFEAEEAALA